jgi:hypothetical protein
MASDSRLARARYPEHEKSHFATVLSPSRATPPIYPTRSRLGERRTAVMYVGCEPITRPVLLLELLSRLVGGIVGWLWLDGETQRADLTAADFLVRGSVAVGVFAVLLWLIFR